MDLLEKYKIKIIDGKRYYELDLNINFFGTELEDTVPYLFQYKDKIIKKSYWGGMAIEILTYIDELTPKTYEQLLVLTYDFCKASVFSRVKRTNFTKFKDIYLNTNHTAGHAFRSIKTLLRAYNINFDECYFLSRKHINTEPDEVKEYYKEETIKEYKYFSLLRGCPANKLDSFVNNIEVLNKQLSKIGTSMNDLFLFDNYIDYFNIECKLVTYIIEHFPCQDNYINAAKRNLFYLEKFYKYRKIIKELRNVILPNDIKEALESHINYLFSEMNSDFLTSQKLYSNIKLKDCELLNSLKIINNPTSLYSICDVLLGTKYCFKNNFISKKESKTISGDCVLNEYINSIETKFNIEELNIYKNKMHLKISSSPITFMMKKYESFVQIDKNIFIKKELLNIDNETIDKIRKEVSFFINSNGSLKTNKYFGYSLLPIIDLERNKFLLVGIVKTFLFNEFDIENLKQIDDDLNWSINLKIK